MQPLPDLLASLAYDFKTKESLSQPFSFFLLNDVLRKNGSDLIKGKVTPLCCPWGRGQHIASLETSQTQTVCMSGTDTKRWSQQRMSEIRYGLFPSLSKACLGLLLWDGHSSRVCNDILSLSGAHTSWTAPQGNFCTPCVQIALPGRM